VANRLDQRHQERLLSSRAVKIGERTVVFIAALPHEGHRLCGIDPLNPLVEVRTRIAVHRISGEAHRDRLHDFRDLEERAQRDLNEMIHRNTQQIVYGADFGFAARLAGSLLANSQIGCARTVPMTAGLGIQGLLIGQPICLLDLALAHRSRTADNST